MPISVLFTAPSVFYTFIKSSPENTNIALKKSKIWINVILIGFIFTIFSFTLNEVVVTKANSLLMDSYKEFITKNSEEQNNAPVFSNEKDIVELNSLQAYKTIEEIKSKDIKNNRLERMILGFYNKFSMPLECLACTIFGAFIGCLMLTEIFNNTWLLVINGLIIPVFLFLYYNLSVSKIEFFAANPIFIFIPSLVIAGFAIIMISGIFLKKDNPTLLKSELF